MVQRNCPGKRKRWSDLKKRVESFFADSVKGRVELRTTRYRAAMNRMGRAWVTIDGCEVASFCTFRAESAISAECRRLKSIEGPEPRRSLFLPPLPNSQYERAKQAMAAESIFYPYDLHSAMFDYLAMSIDDALRAESALLRALGMLDRRLGKRRLATYPIAGEHPLVRRFHSFRCEAEGIPLPKEHVTVAPKPTEQG